MDIGIALSIGAFAFQIIVVAVGATWVVSKISAVTEVLREAIDNLRKSVDDMSARHNGHDERIRQAEQRIAAIRARSSDPMQQS